MKKVILTLVLILSVLGCQSAEEKALAEFKQAVMNLTTDDFIENEQIRKEVLEKFANTNDPASKIIYQKAESAQEMVNSRKSMYERNPIDYGKLFENK